MRDLGFRSLVILFAAVFALAGTPAHAEGHGGAPKHKAKSTLTMSDEAYYITMAPMVLPVINEHGIREVVSMIVALEVKEEKDKDQVNSLVPRLNDAYMRALYGRIDSAVYRNGQFLDVNKLKTKLTFVTDTIVGKGKVQEVLIQGVNQRAYN